MGNAELAKKSSHEGTELTADTEEEKLKKKLTRRTRGRRGKRKSVPGTILNEE